MSKSLIKQAYLATLLCTVANMMPRIVIWMLSRASHGKTSDVKTLESCHRILLTIMDQASIAGLDDAELYQLIRELNDLSERLSVAEVLSETHVEKNDWYHISCCAITLSAIRSEVCDVEPPQLAGFLDYVKPTSGEVVSHG